MTNFNHRNKLLSYLIILVSIFIIIIFTKWVYYDLQENTDLLETKQQELDQKDKDLSSLNNLNIQFSKDENDELLKKVNKYLIEFNDDELVDYIYGSIKWLNIFDDTKIIVRWLSLNKWIKNEIWFTEATINLSINVSSYKALERFINFINDEDNKYNLFLNTISLSYSSKHSGDSEDKSFDISLPIKLIYKS